MLYLWVLLGILVLLGLSRSRVITAVLILNLLLLGSSAEHGEDVVGSGSYGGGSGGCNIGGSVDDGLQKSIC